MTILLFIAAAFADPPQLESTSAVQAIEWARPFSLSESATYGMRGDKPTFDEGWILRLKVEAGMGRARAIETPVLYIGEFPARILNPSETTTCLVVWAPKSGELDQTPIFFGERTLPERVDAASGRAQREAALAAGATFSATLEGALQASTVEAVWSAAQETVQGCR